MTAVLELAQVTFRPKTVAPEASCTAAPKVTCAPGTSGNSIFIGVTFATAAEVGSVTEPSEPPHAMHMANVSDQNVDGVRMAAPRMSRSERHSNEQSAMR
jgi:hypothetical protein